MEEGVTRESLQELLMAARSRGEPFSNVAGLLEAVLAGVPHVAGGVEALEEKVRVRLGKRSRRALEQHVFVVNRAMPLLAAPDATRYVRFSVSNDKKGVRPQRFVRPKWHPLVMAELNGLRTTIGHAVFRDPLWDYVASRGVDGLHQGFRLLVTEPERKTFKAFTCDMEQALNRDDLVTVIAICGRKLDHEAEEAAAVTHAYMRMFFDRVERFAPSNEIRLCRVFVPPPGGEFDSIECETIRAHDRSGVCAAVIKDAALVRLNELCPGLSCQLSSGFGVVIFTYHTETVAFVHDGFGEDLIYRRIDHPEILVAMLRLYRRVIELSAEWQSRRAEIEELLRRAAIVRVTG